MRHTNPRLPFTFYLYLDVTLSKCMPPPQKCTWSRYDLHLWLWHLKTFSAMPTHLTNINYSKFHWNSSTKYGNIASCEIGSNGRSDSGRTDGRAAYPKAQCLSLPIVGWGNITKAAEQRKSVDIERVCEVRQLDAVCDEKIFWSKWAMERKDTKSAGI